MSKQLTQNKYLREGNKYHSVLWPPQEVLAYNRYSQEGPIEAQVSTVANLPTFTLENRRGKQTVRGRRESVQTAKKMSTMGGPTQVQREDGLVSMTFRSGNLVKYKRESRRRR